LATDAGIDSEDGDSAAGATVYTARGDTVGETFCGRRVAKEESFVAALVSWCRVEGLGFRV